MQMRVAPKIVLSEEERGELTKLSRSRRASVRLAQRARIVLLAADGMRNDEIADQLGIGRVQVSRWRGRYAKSRLAGIERDLPRGAPPVKVDVARLVELTTQSTPEAATHWSTRKMAAELGVNIHEAKRAGLIHDIGKALTHEVEGSHALIGADLARKYGESDDVVHAIEAHHNEVMPQTIEAVLTQACDACSGGRPGARRESLEVYVKRLERIEEIAGGRSGVEKVFAMQAGREIRVMVRPDDVDDIGAAVLARDVAKQIEEELTYPGQIRVTVVRESRVTEIAR